MEWYHNLWIVPYIKDKLPFLEQPLPTMPVLAEGQVLPPDVLNTYTAWVMTSKEIAGLMLMTMEPNIQNNIEHLGAYDMLKELKTLYAQQADQELLQTVRDSTRANRKKDNLKNPKNQKKKSYKAAKGNQEKEKAKMGYAPVQALPFAPKPKNPPTPKKDNPVKDAIYYQYGEVSHWRRNSPIYLAELMKKNKLSQGACTLGIFTIELYYFLSTSWVYDTGCGTHICITIQGLRRSRKLKPRALSLYMGDGHRAAVEALLWHSRLGHISKKHIKKLQHGELLDSIEIKSFEKCVSCMSEKIARKPYSHQVERATNLLGLIHTDVCGLFNIMSRLGAKYFVTFTDDFSRYGYVYLLKHKHEVFETFKVFQKEVENQLGKTIKSLRSDRGDEY
nr:retrotransposon protein, putative, Ty1-copia subclass [Tanacetum cinerariifolium]